MLIVLLNVTFLVRVMLRAGTQTQIFWLYISSSFHQHAPEQRPTPSRRPTPQQICLWLPLLLGVWGPGLRLVGDEGGALPWMWKEGRSSWLRRSLGYCLLICYGLKCQFEVIHFGDTKSKSITSKISYLGQYSKTVPHNTIHSLHPSYSGVLNLSTFVAVLACDCQQ